MASTNILVIGGAGYVGSHFVHYARKKGFHVTVMDNLFKGHRSALCADSFVELDLRDRRGILDFLTGNRFDAIFHFAASCLVGESVTDPAQYYENNTLSAFNMLEAMRATNHDRVVFSSTCAVYGHPERVPISEDHPKAPISPYGRTKLTIEWMLEDYHTAYGIRAACLRYFNAAGCEPSEGLGEDHRPETHLIPNIVRYAMGLHPELTIFGADYPTPDGTCIRDYIHVSDLADAHLRALAALDEVPHLKLNLGTGRGFSNKEVVEAVARAMGKDLVPTIGPRRAGDPPELVADASRAGDLLQWRPVRSELDVMVSEVIQWWTDHPGGYPD